MIQDPAGQVPPALQRDVGARRRAGLDVDRVEADRRVVEVRGAEARADVTLERGGHLAGRVLDHRGEPCAGVTVHIYERKEQRNVTRWADEARAWTEKDGRFVTPALRGDSVRLLKSWILADGLHLVVQLETTPPKDGRKEVGDLRPLPGTVVFEADGELRAAASTLTVAAIGEPPGQHAVAVLDALPFTPDGRVSVAGLPVGRCDWVVNDSKRREVGRGRFHATGRDMLVRVSGRTEAGPAEEDGPRDEWRSLRVSVGDVGPGGMLVVASGGAIVAWQRVAEGQPELPEMRLPAGDYRVYLSAGDRIGWSDVAHTAEADLAITLVPAEPARTVTLRILRGGAPVPGAEIWIRGFRTGATGRRAPWAEADADGRALLRGLPSDAAALEIVAIKDGSGRRYAIGIEGRDELTLDLDESVGD